tara:strand:- start:36 stop:566 length:531 start_codon:yes stop_codon:yes gene_type:complete
MQLLKELKRITESVLNVPDISTKCRDEEQVIARFIYFKIAKTNTNISKVKIGEQVLRDRTTVLNGLDKINKYLLDDHKYIKYYQLIEESFLMVKENINNDELLIRFTSLKQENKILLKKNNENKKTLKNILINRDISKRIEKISKDLNSTQVEQMFERMEQFAKMCNYHNQKKKVL